MPQNSIFHTIQSNEELKDFINAVIAQDQNLGFLKRFIYPHLLTILKNTPGFRQNYINLKQEYLDSPYSKKYENYNGMYTDPASLRVWEESTGQKVKQNPKYIANPFNYILPKIRRLFEVAPPFRDRNISPLFEQYYNILKRRNPSLKMNNPYDFYNRYVDLGDAILFNNGVIYNKNKPTARYLRANKGKLEISEELPIFNIQYYNYKRAKAQRQSGNTQQPQVTAPQVGQQPRAKETSVKVSVGQTPKQSTQRQLYPVQSQKVQKKKTIKRNTVTVNNTTPDPIIGENVDIDGIVKNLLERDPDYILDQIDNSFKTQDFVPQQGIEQEPEELVTSSRMNMNRRDVRKYLQSVGLNPYDYGSLQRRQLRKYFNGELSEDEISPTVKYLYNYGR